MLSTVSSPSSSSPSCDSSGKMSSSLESPKESCLPLATPVSHVPKERGEQRPAGGGNAEAQLDDFTRRSTSFAAGALAGALAKTAIAPLDRTKIYFQTHPTKNYRISGAIRFLRKTYTNDGFLALWRGNSATICRVAPYAAIQFLSHDEYKKLLKIDAKSKDPPGFRNFLAGSAAGMTGQSLTYPLDRARAVMAVTKVGEYKNLYSVFNRIIVEEQYRGLYRGFSATMVGVVIYAGTSFYTFETLKHAWSDYNKSVNPEADATPSFLQRLSSGSVAGFTGQLAAYPLDIVRRRMQTARQMGFASNKYASIAGTLMLVYQREGIFKGWYKGITMNMIKGPISNGISFTTYDYCKMVVMKVYNVTHD